MPLYKELPSDLNEVDVIIAGGQFEHPILNLFPFLTLHKAAQQVASSPPASATPTPPSQSS
jgi:hypothetical protein